MGTLNVAWVVYPFVTFLLWEPPIRGRRTWKSPFLRATRRMTKKGLKHAECLTYGPLSLYKPHTTASVTFLTAKTVVRKTAV